MIFGCEIISTDVFNVAVKDGADLRKYERITLCEVQDIIESGEYERAIVTSSPMLCEFADTILECFEDKDTDAQYVDATELMLEVDGFAGQDSICFLYVGAMKNQSKLVHKDSYKQDIKKDYVEESDSVIEIYEVKYENQYCILHDPNQNDFDESSTITHGVLLKFMDLAILATEYVPKMKGSFEILGYCNSAIIYKENDRFYMSKIIGTAEDFITEIKKCKKIANCYDEITVLFDDSTVSYYGSDDFGQSFSSTWTDIKDVACSRGVVYGVTNSGNVLVAGSMVGGLATLNLSKEHCASRIFANEQNVAIMKDDDTITVYNSRSFEPSVIKPSKLLKDLFFLKGATVAWYDDGTIECFGEDRFGISKEISLWKDIKALYVRDRFAVGFNGERLLTSNIVSVNEDEVDMTKFLSFLTITENGFSFQLDDATIYHRSLNSDEALTPVIVRKE